MATDLPPYLTHNHHRRVAWKGHDVFPRNVVKLHKQGDFYGKYGLLFMKDLRIFKRFGLPSTGIEYHLMSETEIRNYMEDPTRV